MVNNVVGKYGFGCRKCRVLFGFVWFCLVLFGILWWDVGKQQHVWGSVIVNNQFDMKGWGVNSMMANNWF